jgi:hypothetical protein
MKSEKKVLLSVASLLVIGVCLLFVSGVFSQGITGNAGSVSSRANVTVKAGNFPPNVTYVSTPNRTDLVPCNSPSARVLTFNFVAYDVQGNTYLPTANLDWFILGNVTRSDGGKPHSLVVGGCQVGNAPTNYCPGAPATYCRNYTCQVSMNYFDDSFLSPYSWNITIRINDTMPVNNPSNTNFTSNFTLQKLPDFIMDPDGVNWSLVQLSASNIPADKLITIKNCGNVLIKDHTPGATNITIKAIDLKGESTTYGSDLLLATLFVANRTDIISHACQAPYLPAVNFNVPPNDPVWFDLGTNINYATSTPSTPASDTIGFCLEGPVPGSIHAQSYSSDANTGAGGTWTIRINS